MKIHIFVPTWRQAVFVVWWALLTHGLVYWFCRDLPYSACHQVDEEQREAQLDRLRVWALEALADAKAASGGVRLFDRWGARKICVGVLSYASGTRRQTAVTVGALLARMRASQQDRIRLAVLNVDGNEETDELQDLVRVERLDYPAHYPRRQWIAQAKAQRLLEYALALRYVGRMGCEYGLLLEDTAVAGADWAQRLLDLVDDVGPDPGWVVARLMGEYSRVRYSLRTPGDFFVALSLSALAFLLVWGATLLAFAFVDETSFADLGRPSLLTVLLLLGSFYAALLLLGKPNFPPMRGDIRRLDTGYLAVANLYPRERLEEYAHLLEQHYRDMRYHGALAMLTPHDQLYGRLRRQLERQEGNPYWVVTMAPSLFQRVAGIDPDAGVAQYVTSYDWPDGDKRIKFDVQEFLERNPRRAYPDAY